MKFHKVRTNVSVSECGNYEVRSARLNDGRAFHNAWHLPTEKHVTAGMDGAQVKRECAEHAAKIVPRGTQEAA